MLAYLHLDCIDGKQARRTKSSSPLGQLFDHGKFLHPFVRQQDKFFAYTGNWCAEAVRLRRSSARSSHHIKIHTIDSICFPLPSALFLPC